MSYKITTTDLSQFGMREIEELHTLLGAWIEKGLPDDFYPSDVKPMLNRNSGNVFLTNEDYQVAMMNGDRLESFYSCPECGSEGFAGDIEWDADKCRCGECTANSEEE